MASRLQLVVRIGLPEGLQHRGGRGPVFETDECGAGVILGHRPDVGAGRGLRDPQEVIGGRPMVLREVGLLTLLVDRRCQVVDHGLTRVVIRGRHLEHTRA